MFGGAGGPGGGGGGNPFGGGGGFGGGNPFGGGGGGGGGGGNPFGGMGKPEEKPEDNYYNLLGVKKDANDKEIKKAFKKKAIQHHPDKNLDDVDSAKEKFAKIANAYEVLSDAEKRRVYDQVGAEGV